MNQLDLFSGIGGFSFAGQQVWGKEHHIHCFVENNKFCQKVLKKHWPNVKIHDDIRTYKHNGTKIDLLTGGFPCQPFSVAGKQRGSKDDRYLWPEMLRVITEVRPTWVIGENVTGIIHMELDKVLSDLENQGYETQTFIIPACAVDAPHRRDRVWILGYFASARLQTKWNERTQQSSNVNSTSKIEDVADAQRIHDDSTRHGTGKNGGQQSGQTKILRNGRKWLPEPPVGRVANGISRRVDRLRSLGNAIVPQVVIPIMESIKKIEELDK